MEPFLRVSASAEDHPRHSQRVSTTSFGVVTPRELPSVNKSVPGPPVSGFSSTTVLVRGPGRAVECLGSQRPVGSGGSRTPEREVGAGVDSGGPQTRRGEEKGITVVSDQSRVGFRVHWSKLK